MSIILITSIHSQSLDSYKWKNRLILIFSSDLNSSILHQQLKEMETDSAGFIDRKLRVLKILKHDYPNLKKNDGFIEDNTIYDKFFDEKDSFKVVLIGLDGEIKVNQNTLLSKEKLFSIIDGMPMRQAEMNEN